MQRHEKRSAAGYGGKGVMSETDILKFNPGQPRTSAGNGIESGRWSKDDAGGAQLVPVGGDYAPATGVRPDRPGWHDFLSHVNEVCSPELQCNEAAMRTYLLRFAIPGQDPAVPVQSGQRRIVKDPWQGFIPGVVRTYISSDGLEVTNNTTMFHALHSGTIVRRANKTKSGGWSMVTHGYGNNIYDLMDAANQYLGPKIFNEVDRQMADYILKDRNHGH